MTRAAGRQGAKCGAKAAAALRSSRSARWSSLRADRRAARCDARQPALRQAARRRADRAHRDARIARSSRVEENVVAGGAGSADQRMPGGARHRHAVLHLGIPDRFIEHGSREDCLAAAGLDPLGRGAITRWWHAEAVAVGGLQKDRAPRRLFILAPEPTRAPIARRSALSAWRHFLQRAPRPRPNRGRAGPRRFPRASPINKVGIKDIYHPVRVKDRSAGEQHTIANFNMYVALPHNFKGTHMSRFVECCTDEREISVESFRDMLEKMTERLDADAGHIEMSFPFFVMKKAPVSGVESLMDYHASLIGERRNGEHGDVAEGRGAGDQPVPVLQEHLRLRRAQPALARHDQGALRSHIWIEELIDIAESEASCELFGILKRPGREVRDRARLRQSEVRRGHGARRRGAAEQRRARARLRRRSRRTSSRSTTTRPTR